MKRLRYWLSLVANPWKLWHDIQVQWLRQKGMHIQSDVTIRFPLCYRNPHNIYIDEGAVIGEGAFLVAGSHSLVRIGMNTLLAPNVHINGTKHVYKDSTEWIKYQGGTEKTVTVFPDC